MDKRYKDKRTNKQFHDIYCRILQLILAVALLLASLPMTGTADAQAAAAQKATLRIISSTDLHGQVSKMHYDSGEEKVGCLAQAYTLMQQAREEAGAANVLTFDIGDSVYGYAADYLSENANADAVQPIYKAMAAVGYDAITLGNHDFDYGYGYIDRQLELSGLKDKCVLSNVVSGDTGKTAWNETKILTKNVQTDKGKSVKVKIGLIGVTILTMSPFSDCKEELVPLPIVNTVKKEADALEKKGVDLVVVLAHSSFGSRSPSDTDNNAVYALTKLDNVDAVVAGHGHRNFPSTDAAAAPFYKLPNVDLDTGLVNDKPVTMVKDHGAGIGVMDLDLKITSNGKIKVSGAATEVRRVTKETASSQVILDAQAAEIAAVDQSLTNVVAKLPADKEIDSYFALLEDNYAIQLVNEAKIQYGMAYTGGAGKAEYGDLPVIAFSNYELQGKDSPTDNIDLNGSITMRDILNMQIGNHSYNKLYLVTGSQLIEWMEWSASIYNTANGTITSDEVLERLLEQRGAGSIVASDWLDDWDAFGVFDGVEYTIDTTKGPRYSKEGKLLDPNSHRVTKLTYNGNNVLADQEFILVANTANEGVEATGTIESQKVLGKTDRAYQTLLSYIKTQQEFGELPADTDNNWDVLFNSEKDYIVRASVLSKQEAMMKDWFRELVASNETFAYYLAQFIQSEEEKAYADVDGPLLVVASTCKEETDGPVEVKVQANDRSGLKPLKWLPGQQAADSSLWETAETVSGGAIAVTSNGIYSVKAEDVYGNGTVKYVDVDNINTAIAQAPTINKVNNRSTILTGTSKYGTTVFINAGGKNYEVDVLEDGTYACTIPCIEAGKTVSAYCTDAAGRRSRTTEITVVKKGPNIPVIQSVSNKTLHVSGQYTDASSTVVAISGSTVYCSGAAGKAVYETSQLYNAKYQVEIAEYAQKSRGFSLTIPAQKAGHSVKFIALDKAGRRSAALSLQVQDKAPDLPHIDCSLGNYVLGRVTNVHDRGTVKVTVGGKSYQGDIQNDGTFVVLTKGVEDYQQVTVTASDVKNGTKRTSLKLKAAVPAYQHYAGNLTAQAIYDDMTEITGKAAAGSAVSYLVDGKIKQAEVNSNGRYTGTLAKTLKAGKQVYVIARDSSGKVTGVCMKKVLSSVPETPSVLDSDITFDTKKLKVLAKEPAVVVMEIDGEEYARKKKGTYNQAYGGYIYNMKLPETKKKQKITIYLVSDRGVSSKPITLDRKGKAKK